MALPSSGQISFNDVRTEMSQSSTINYEMSGWVGGLNYVEGTAFAPINILSSGSRWYDTVTPTPVNLSTENLKISDWYDYNSTLYLTPDTTGTLYPHMQQYYDTSLLSQTMIPYYIGNQNKTIKIRWSGSIASTTTNNYTIDAWYGRPWYKNGNMIYGGQGGDFYNDTHRTHVTWSTKIDSILTQSFDFTYDWSYTYDSNKGEYLYIVLSTSYYAL